MEETVKVRVKGKVFAMKIDRLGRIFFTVLSRDYLKWENEITTFLDKAEDGSIIIKQ